VTKRIEVAAVITGFACLAIATTYPLVLVLGTHLPSDLGDPLLNAWTLAWDASRIPHGFAGLWDAPNFFPYRRTLAYSDHLLGIAVFTAPLQWLTHNPVLVHNVAFLASVIWSGSGMYVLTRSLTGRPAAALVAGVIYACLPFRVSHVSHLQWLMTGWLPLGLWALHRYFDTGKWRHLMASAVCFLLQGMTAMYFLYFALVPFGVVAVAEVARRQVPLSRLARHLVPILLLLGATLAPIVRAYVVVSRENGLRRTREDIASHSADVADYVRAAPQMRLWSGLGTTGAEHDLFPGAIALALACVGVVAMRRTRAVTIYGTIAGLAFVLSLGVAPTAWGRSLPVPGPYGWLLAIVPGLDGLRAVARLGLIVALALAVLAAFGAAWLLGRVKGRARPVMLAALVAGPIAEGWAAPIATRPLTLMTAPGEPDAYEYLRQSPPGGVFELPASLQRFERESQYQYLTLVHGHPVVNGFSGYATPLLRFFAGGQSPLNEADRLGDSIASLRAVGVRYLVVHHDAFDDRSVSDAWRAAFAAERTQIISERRFGGTTVAALLPAAEPAVVVSGSPILPSAIHAHASHSPDRLPFLFDGDLDGRWLSGAPQSGDEWISLRFDRARDVAAIRLRIAERSYGDYPREIAIDSIDDGGSTTLFRGSVLPALARGLLADGKYPAITLFLTPNRSRELRLRQLGKAGRFFWSIHELEVWER
jgi:hypothetical protein